MHAFHHGELLIGGMALRHLHGELEQEEPLTDSSCWRLAGKLKVSDKHQSQLELERQYLLRVDDGREGMVELTRVTESDEGLEADFRPRSLPPQLSASERTARSLDHARRDVEWAWHVPKQFRRRANRKLLQSFAVPQGLASSGASQSLSRAAHPSLIDRRVARSISAAPHTILRPSMAFDVTRSKVFFKSKPMIPHVPRVHGVTPADFVHWHAQCRR